MQDANHALIPVLNLVVEGRYARVTEAETATIESGMSGQNRNDLVCLKYTRNSQNIETAAIAVLKGTPNTGTAADPDRPVGQHPLGLRHGVDPDRPHPDQRDHARHAGHAHQTAASHAETV